MENITIQITAGDSGYREALAGSLMKNRSCFVFLPEGVENEEGPVIRIKEYEDAGNVGGSGDDSIVFLTDREELTDEENSIYFKYGNIKELADGIVLAHFSACGKTAVPAFTENVRVFAIASSCGGCGCTSIALGTAQELTRFYGKNILCISFENFESTEKYFKKKSRGIREYLYYMGSGETEKCSVPEIFMSEDQYGVKMFSPSEGRNPITELDRKGFIGFIEQAVRTGKFDGVVCDIGSSICEAALAAMEMCRAVGFIGGKRDESSIRWLKEMIPDMEEGKIIPVINRHEEEDEEAGTDRDGQNGTVWIPEDEDSLKGGISLDGDFGSGIKELTGMMTDI